MEIHGIGIDALADSNTKKFLPTHQIFFRAYRERFVHASEITSYSADRLKWSFIAAYSLH